MLRMGKIYLNKYKKKEWKEERYTRNLESDKFKCNDTVQLVYMLTVDK